MDVGGGGGGGGGGATPTAELQRYGSSFSLTVTLRFYSFETHLNTYD